MGNHRFKDLARSGIPAAVLAVLMSLIVWQAMTSPTFAFDEPLWFMRSQTSPMRIDTPEREYWAIDVPAMNRWAYFAVLKVTGLDRVPPGEPCPWSMRDGRIYWNDWKTPEHWGGHIPLENRWDWLIRVHGRYSPRKGILAMRMVNIAAFGLCLIALWYAAKMALKSPGLAVLAVIPIILSPLFATEMAFVSWSGDVFMMAFSSVVLAAMLHFHLRGRGASGEAVIIVGAFSGLATASKHPGVLVVLMFMVYLALEAKGTARLWKPAAAAGCAFGVFAALNPAVFYHPNLTPLRALLRMMSRRAELVQQFVSSKGPMSVTILLRQTLYIWPLLPLAAVALWACRKQEWFKPVFLWTICLSVPTAAGLVYIRMFQPRYMSPLELSVYFSFALAVLSLASGSLKREVGDSPIKRSPESA